MKRAKTVLLILLLLTAAFAAEAEAQYTALADIEFHLRDEPDGKWVAKVPAGSRITVLERDGEWCLAEHKGVQGYCKTKWLYCARSLDPMRYPLWDNPCRPAGYAVLRHDTVIRAGKFGGTTAAAADAVCASPSGTGGYELCVWRDKQILPSAEAEYHPFAAWDSARPGDVIGGFTTYYCDSQGKKRPREREANIQLACSRIDGAVLAAGGSFSFNTVCGPYKKSNGYLLAPNVSKSGEGYGGGVCQVSTTLYNALLTLPLRIDEWYIHRYSGMPYVPQFFDAAVSSYSDLVFVNTLPYPIRLQTYARRGIINVFIIRAE